MQNFSMSKYLNNPSATVETGQQINQNTANQVQSAQGASNVQPQASVVLEKTPPADKIEISTNKENKNKKNIVLATALGIIGLGTAAFLAVKFGKKSKNLETMIEPFNFRAEPDKLKELPNRIRTNKAASELELKMADEMDGLLSQFDEVQKFGMDLHEKTTAKFKSMEDYFDEMKIEMADFKDKYFIKKRDEVLKQADEMFEQFKPNVLAEIEKTGQKTGNLEIFNGKTLTHKIGYSDGEISSIQDFTKNANMTRTTVELGISKDGATRKVAELYRRGLIKSAELGVSETKTPNGIVEKVEIGFKDFHGDNFYKDYEAKPVTDVYENRIKPHKEISIGDEFSSVERPVFNEKGEFEYIENLTISNKEEVPYSAYFQRQGADPSRYEFRAVKFNSEIYSCEDSLKNRTFRFEYKKADSGNINIDGYRGNKVGGDFAVATGNDFLMFKDNGTANILMAKDNRVEFKSGGKFMNFYDDGRIKATGSL